MKKHDENGAEFLIRLGNKIRELRTEKHISQESFAFESGFDRTYVSMVERGKRNLSIVNLRRISVTLGVSLCNLLNGIE